MLKKFSKPLSLALILSMLLSVIPSLPTSAVLADDALELFAATVSSTDGDFAAEYAIDGDTATRWQATANDGQWIYVDLGSSFSLSRVELMWEAAYATSYAIEVSLDRANWDIIKTVTSDGGTDENALSAEGRYVRIREISRAESKYGISLFEIKVFGSEIKAESTDNYLSISSAAASTGNASLAIDGDSNTLWQGDANDGEWITFDLGGITQIEKIFIDWETAYASTYNIDISLDGNNWKTIQKQNSDGETDRFAFSDAVARYIRIDCAKRSNNKYGAGIYEIRVCGKALNFSSITPLSATASSTDGDFAAEYAIDGDSSTRWQAASELDGQWFYVDLGKEYVLNSLDISWEAAYASEYAVETSNNASVWTEVARVTSDGGEDTVSLGYAVARYVRIFCITRSDKYGMSFYEFRLTGAYANENISTEDIYAGQSIPEERAETMLFSSSFEDTDMAATSSADEKTGMTVETGTGPSVTWNNKYKNVGFTGYKALSVSGTHKGSDAVSYSSTVYSGLSIPVTGNTRLSYVIYPSTLDENSYDYEYTQQYMCVDLAFTDGTKLSNLGAIDQNGFGMTAQAQGDSQALYTNQWNYIESKIGDVAFGKTIESIIVTYAKDKNTTGNDARYLAYFDDIEIKNAEDIKYEHVSDYVNILRGTNSSGDFSRGLTTPAVTYPHGFNLFTPVTDKGNKLPYSYQLGGSRNTLSSLQISHCSSYWVGYYGTWQFMANTSVNAANGITADSISAENRKAEFTHDNEIAKAHYYAVTFDEGSNASGVKTEISPTMYGAMVRFTFPEGSANRNIIFDCENADGYLSVDTSTGRITAYTDDNIYYSRRMHIYGEIMDVESGDMTFTSANEKSGILSFNENVTSVTIKLATSFMSEIQAKRNLALDMGDFDRFEDAYFTARDEWDKVLGTVEIEEASYTELVSFYSSLYRVYAHPTVSSENIGTEEDVIMQYASPYNGGLTDPTFKDGGIICNTGLWDTYRTAWPAYTFFNVGGIDASAMIDGLLQHFIDRGWNGQWISYGGFQCMIGSHSDVVYADAAIKGTEFDFETAMDSMLKNASVVSGGGIGREETETAVFTGYTTNATPRGLSWTLDDCVNNYGIYRMAEMMGLKDEAEYYRNRALSYVTVFNDSIDFFIGKDANGNWTRNSWDFNPEDWLDDYCESNAWNVTFNVVHDVQGMINLYGGKDNFNAKLDEMFSTPVTNVYSDSIHEVREMREVRLGQYEHSNQIAHHIPYLYDYSGQPWKTQETVRSLLSRCYVGSEIGQGYVGDEDNGEQSGWYVFSSLGFYPMNLASGEYAIGSPLFKKSVIHLPTGDITIIANNNSSENIYIQSCTINGQSYDKAYLTQELLSSGNVEIVFEMGNRPSAWASSDASAPTSLSSSGTVDYKTDKLNSSNTTVSNGDNGAALFDNTSETVCKANGTMTVTVNLGEKKTATMLTVTSAKEAEEDADTAPTSFTLYGSNDGNNWVKLDSRSGIDFKWEQYTRPFAIPEGNRNAYQYYRVDLSGNGNISVAELELIG